MKDIQKKNKTIILIGMMGAGKSTVGSILSRKLKLGFMDFDDIIEKQQKMTIAKIFALYGEEKFRELELSLVYSLDIGQNAVISTGGGIVENKNSIETLKEKGRIYYLKAPHDILYERIKNDTKRPLLLTKSPKEAVKKILEKRKMKYECADFIVDTVNKEAKEIVDEIIKIYEKING